MGAAEIKTTVKSGIYIVRSERAKTVGFFHSRNCDVRVRKLRSDYRNGKRRHLLERMGIALAGDVVFEVVDQCPSELFGVRTRSFAEEWIGKGYEVYGWTGEKAGEQREWGPCGKLRELAGRHGMTDAGVMELLDQIETVLERRG